MPTPPGVAHAFNASALGVGAGAGLVAKGEHGQRAEAKQSVRLWGDSQEVFALGTGKHSWRRRHTAAIKDGRPYQPFFSKPASTSRASYSSRRASMFSAEPG